MKHFTERTSGRKISRDYVGLCIIIIVLNGGGHSWILIEFFFEGLRAQKSNYNYTYRIYSINRPGRLLNFWALRVGAYSRLGAY